MNTTTPEGRMFEKAIVAYYAIDGNIRGGPCAPVLEELRCDDATLAASIRACHAVNDWLGEAILQALLRLPLNERGEMLR